MKASSATLLVLLLSVSTPAISEEVKAQEEKKTNPVVLMKTNRGEIQIELFAQDAPETVANFIGLAEGTKEWTDPQTGQKVKKPFYDGLKFHRVIKNFMIQGGCPLGTGSGSPGFKFKDEISAKSLGLDKMNVLDENGQPHPNLGIRFKHEFNSMIVQPLAKSMGINNKEEWEKRQEEIQARLAELTLEDAYELLMGYQYDDKLKSHQPLKGVLAMANSGPNTNGSQFFINLIDTPWLTGKHTVFGKVVKGMEVVEAIGEVKVDGGSKPAEDIKIESLRVIRK